MPEAKTKKAIIIGAGPAGLTAAYELLTRTDIQPIIFEQTSDIGGISKTVNYKNNRMDIGGHRFFSKSQRVVNWWLQFFHVQTKPSKEQILLQIPAPTEKGATSKTDIPQGDPEANDLVMLLRQRISRIFFLRKFFDYPISLSIKTIRNLGIFRMLKIGFSYLCVKIRPIKEEKTLEDFFINRFGKTLYRTFFEDYTEKVWGIPCHKISAEWGAQRIKGLSITKTLQHAIRKLFPWNQGKSSKQTETSLIEQFMYPKLGPGQLWEHVAQVIEKKGGILHRNSEVIGIVNKASHVEAVKVRSNGETKVISADYIFSTMPVKDLISRCTTPPPEPVRHVANGLMYRDFMTVGLLLKRLLIKNNTRVKTIDDMVPDNWIYIQERDVKLGRLQIFNNWSSYMVNDLHTIFLGLEYFCNEGDELWNMQDDAFSAFAIQELEKIGIVNAEDVLDSVVVRMPKAYPAYFGAYDKFKTIQQFTDTLENLFLIGRNGMHRYNNMDHSMLSAMTAVDNIVNNILSKANIWAVNTETSYHETK